MYLNVYCSKDMIQNKPAYTSKLILDTFYKKK